MIRRGASIVALVSAAALAVFGSTRPLSHLFITLEPGAPRTEYVTTGWRTDLDPHSPLFGIPLVIAAAILLMAPLPRTRHVATAGAAMLLGVTGMLLLYVTAAIDFQRQGNLAIDPDLQAGYGHGAWLIAIAALAALVGAVLHPTRPRRASPVTRAP